ncbi:helix-turn-helix domain-containing protein [Scandinavium goeteborgense]|uniref:helix-turn-helix domain-containing protein n=2 Tax=Scandinavium TaxID=2726810 RepID=UPI002166A327|nr:helix-turn-helix transcriptional regulator [Scandinavium goeteborgense]MCS2153338.1 helix-turn-helix domain-containing protein [Scandinavium goeteborgense]
MSKKIINWDDVRAEMLAQPGVQAAFDAEVRQERLREMLAQWREHAGLTRSQVAQRMGVSAPTVSRMEANVTRASLDTLTRYALACGVESPLIQLY